MRPIDTYSLPYTAKAEWTTYLIFSIFFVPILLLWVFISFQHPASNAWEAVLILFIMLSIFLAWIGAFKIILQEDRLFYSTLLSKNNEILFSDITRIGFKVLSAEESARKSALIVLEIYTKIKEAPLAINMKPFSKRDLAILVDVVSKKNPEIDMDAVTLKLKEGEFKPVSISTIKNFWKYFLRFLWIMLAILFIRSLLFK